MLIRGRVYHRVSAYFVADYRIRNNAKDYVGWAAQREGQPIGDIIRSVLSTRNRQTPVGNPPGNVHIHVKTVEDTALYCQFN